MWPNENVKPVLIFCAQILYPFQMICFQAFVLVHSHKMLTIQQGKFLMQWNWVEDRELGILCLLAQTPVTKCASSWFHPSVL